MATITEPMALDASFNTTETTPRNIADVLAEMGEAIAQGMGRQANEVAYDNTTSGLSADDVQEAVDELAAEKVDKVTGKGLSTNDYTDEEKSKLAGIEAGAQVNVQSDWAQTDSNADDYIKNKQLVTEPIEELQNDVKSTQTATGNPITLTDCAPINAESLVVELEPKQDLHGQDVPYVGGAGKNKMPSGEQKTGTSGNLTVTCDGNGHYTVNGTTGSNAEYVTFSCEEFTILDAENATLYLMNSATNSSVYFRFYNSGVMIDNFALTPTNRKVSYTTMKGATCKTFMIYVLANTSVNNLTLSPMICDNANETTFAPYSNICPITGYNECDVDDVGKNLVSGRVSGCYINASGTITDGSDYDMCYAEVKAGVTYTATTDEAAGLVCGFFSAIPTKYAISYDGQRIVQNSTTITSPIDGYIAFRTSAGYSTPQLEKGNQPTTYEPYHSSNATITLGQTVYGGSVDFLTGECVVSLGFEKFKNLSFDDTSTGGKTRYTAVVSDMLRLSVRDMKGLICESYETISDEREYASVPDFCIYNGISGSSFAVIIVHDTRFSSAADFKTAMGECEFCYELAEPFTIHLTPQELQLLKQYNNITTNGTTINLDYIPDNSIGDAVKASEEYTNRQVNREIENHLEMPYLRILDNDVDTEVKNYQLYYRMIASAYTLVNLAEMLQYRFLFIEVIQNPSGTSNDKLLHSALIDPRTIDGFEYQMKAGTGDTVCIKTNIAENKLDLYVQSTGTHTSGDPTDYYVTIRMVD